MGATFFKIEATKMKDLEMHSIYTVAIDTNIFD